jgi:hypothetical protein
MESTRSILIRYGLTQAKIEALSPETLARVEAANAAESAEPARHAKVMAALQPPATEAGAAEAESAVPATSRVRRKK